MWNLLFARSRVIRIDNLRQRLGRRPIVEALENRCSPSSIRSFIDLGTLGGVNSYGLAINSSGMVVGDSYAYLFYNMNAYSCESDNGTMTDLGTLGGNFSEALGINDSGQIVGDSMTSDGYTHAFLDSGKMLDLGTLGGLTSSARAINNAGAVVGQSTTASGSN